MRGDVDMDAVCTAAIKHWGVISQLLMVVEEHLSTASGM